MSASQNIQGMSGYGGYSGGDHGDSSSTSTELGLFQQVHSTASVEAGADRLRETFYNLLVDEALKLTDFSQFLTADGQASCVQGALLEMLLIGRDSMAGAVMTFGGGIRPEEHCPDALQDLLPAFAAAQKVLQGFHKALSGSDLRMLFSAPDGELVMLDGDTQAAVKGLRGHLAKFSQLVMQKPAFALKIKKAEQFVKEAIGQCRVVLDAATLEKSTVDVEDVRSTFYNVMAELALEPGLFPSADLRDQEVYVYLGLPACTLLEVIERSADLKGAVWLQGNHPMTLDNCPKEYEAFAQVLFPLKEAVLKLSKAERKVLQRVCIGDPERPVPHHQSTVVIGSLASKLNSVATQVTQMKSFKELVPEILAMF